MFTPSRSSASTLSGELEAFALQAVVPEHLPSYVRAISGATPILCADCLAYEQEGTVVLVGYPLENGQGADRQDWLNNAINEALRLPQLRNLTVLAPIRPSAAPSTSSEETDLYWSLPIPAAPGQKVRNMITRARRDCRISPDLWTVEHAELVEEFIRTHPLNPGTRHLFRKIEAYLTAVPEALLFSARAIDNERLEAFCVGDFSSRTTAMYLFAFRRAAASTVPGVADALLATLIEEADRRRQIRVNLGLGIHPGITFFKQKWQAEPFLSYVETSWTLSRPWWRVWTKK